MKENYALRMEQELAWNQAEDRKPTLLMHACCAPCSSYVLEALAGHFRMTLFYYNPNITPAEEFAFRHAELERFLHEAGYAVSVVCPPYDPEEFFAMACGLESLPEGGERCRRCYELRLRKTAKAAQEGGYDAFCTTLSISPYKNAAWLNEIGEALEAETGVHWLPSDFKKKNGYKRSIELSAEYGLYRQNYCGCVYSKLASEQARRERKSASESADCQS